MNQATSDLPVDLTEGDITRIQLGETEILLVGTAHISQESVDIVVSTIAAEKPDVVAVELDQERFDSMRSEQNWEDLDLLQIIKNKQLTFLLARLALGSFQKRMGGHTGVKPGAEMAAAIDAAEADQMGVELIDRNIRTTLLRAWRTTAWWKRAELVMALMLGVFQKGEVNEEELSDLREMENISTILDQLGEEMPDVKKVLVDERDTYMAYKLANIDAKKVVAVVGAAHKPGILRQIREQISDEHMTTIDTVPPKGSWGKALTWLFPVLVVGLFVWGFFNADATQLKNAALAWILANGIFAALGTAIALAHPLTIIAAFIAAPITSLHPGIGAGMVTALVQTLVAGPKVGDFQTIGDDISSWKGWWTNRLGRVLLVFIFSGMGSSLGTFVALGWLKNLI
ncbi:TraB/GumN family protein [Bradymonas sediminis]|uniref:TraB family protein n=1 Tax=Bradymonas sediminis TaxID=1548548 RepID=A0A2Z4FKK8_9DELT|nr:TraB/GumN family protein [Bradymonas sediminis]AWV89511.1 TraB family protein [Bradymonas sediminis]TDP76762.1 pheromone shutdown-related protein TraB [Bradymonas sediminis]